jgi:NTE family protein
VLDLVDNQVRSLRKRQVIDSFKQGLRLGAYWGIRTDVLDYGVPDALRCPIDATMKLAETPTRLQAMNDLLQERLINWGYAVCDAALRKYVNPAISAPADFPFPAAKV